MRKQKREGDRDEMCTTVEQRLRHLAADTLALKAKDQAFAAAAEQLAMATRQLTAQMRWNNTVLHASKFDFQVL